MTYFSWFVITELIIVFTIYLFFTQFIHLKVFENRILFGEKEDQYSATVFILSVSLIPYFREIMMVPLTVGVVVLLSCAFVLTIADFIFKERK